MVPAMMVELDPIGRESPRFWNGLIAPQASIFVSQAPPQPLDEDVVHPAASLIHADLNAFLLKLGDPILAGKLAALIRVEDLRFASRR